MQHLQEQPRVDFNLPKFMASPGDSTHKCSVAVNICHCRAHPHYRQCQFPQACEELLSRTKISQPIKVFSTDIGSSQIHDQSM